MPTTAMFFGKVCDIPYHEGWSMTLSVGITFGNQHAAFPMRYFHSSPPTVNAFYFIVAKWFYSSQHSLIFEIQAMYHVPKVPLTMTHPMIVATVVVSKLDTPFPKDDLDDNPKIQFEGQLNSYVRKPTTEQSEDTKPESKFSIPIHHTCEKSMKGVYPYIKQKSNVYILGTLHVLFKIKNRKQYIDEVYIDAKKFDFTNIDKSSPANIETSMDTLTDENDIVFVPVCLSSEESPKDSEQEKRNTKIEQPITPNVTPQKRRILSIESDEETDRDKGRKSKSPTTRQSTRK
jgi:hypothetical protein